MSATRIIALALYFVAVAIALRSGAADSAVTTMPPSTDALSWLNALGRVAEFKPPSSSRTWASQRKKIRAQLNSLLGDLPSRPSDVARRCVVLGRELRDGYWLERFQFDNGAGSVVPGYLLLPENRPSNGKSPAILYCHWHGGQYEVGKEELFRTNATPVAMGPELARRGYVVIAIDAYCFGERNGRGPGGSGEKGSAGEMTASKFQLWAGRSLWGMILRDDLIALDYLCSRAEVDPKRIGVTGISMGATRSWWLMALDDRIRCGSAVCCLTRYQDLIRAEGLKYHGIYYFVPGMLRHFDTEAVVALAAPRPLLFQSGELDAGSPMSGINSIVSAVKPVYDLTGKGTNFVSRIYPRLGHVYTPEMLEQTLSWLDRHLELDPSRGRGSSKPPKR